MVDPKFDPKNPRIHTFTGKEFWFLHCGPEDFCIEDIAHSLARQCRWSGHTAGFWPVAAHCVEVSNRFNGVSLGGDPKDRWNERMWGLLHDASEAYVGDITGPLKSQLAFNRPEQIPVGSLSGCPWHVPFREWESYLLWLIAEKFELPWPVPPDVKAADQFQLGIEAQRFYDPTMDMSPHAAEHAFLHRFRTLEEQRP